MLTPCAVARKNSISPRKIASLKSVVVAPISPGLDASPDWPRREDIIRFQQSTSKRPDKKFKPADGIIETDRGVVWIPVDDSLLKSWSPATPECAGLPRCSAWTGLSQEVEIFVKYCVH